MRISSDGVFDTEPWETYSTTKPWTLTAGDGSKTVYARFRDPSLNESDTVSTGVILDTTPPAVAVTLTPPMAAPGDSLHIRVGATDPSGVDSITADGTPLAQTGASTWEGSTTAASARGVHSVRIAATDVLGHSVDNIYVSYLTAGVVALAGRGLSDPILTLAGSRWLFRVCGSVTVIDSDTFDLDNGSGVIVRVSAPGYTGIGNGDYASARGIVNVSANPTSLSTSAEFVQKLN